jgi:3-oxoacyl-[acyl-carrier-protein] synthase-3
MLVHGSGAHAPVEDSAATRARAGDIKRKTGLVERRFFAPDVSPIATGLELLERLLAEAGLGWAELDGLIVSSSSTQGFPGLSQQIVAAARIVHPELGHPFVLDVSSNACTGFMYGLGIGASTLGTLRQRAVAVLAIEFSSRCLRYDNKSFGISTLFGDAAAGMLLAPDGPARATLEAMRLTSRIDRDSVGLVRGGGMQAHRPDLPVPLEARWFMAGPPVALGAIEILLDEVRHYQSTGVDVDWLIPHQANLTRILEPACDKLGIARERLCASFERTGNTSSASIPLLVDELLKSGRARPGDDAVLVGFGASFSVGSAHLRIGTPRA